jgi:hypothetical protein
MNCWAWHKWRKELCVLFPCYFYFPVRKLRSGEVIALGWVLKSHKMLVQMESPSRTKPSRAKILPGRTDVLLEKSSFSRQSQGAPVWLGILVFLIHI